MQKKLKRGIFPSAGDQRKYWLPFKYESLPGYCYGCGCMGHNVKDCDEILATKKDKPEDELPYSIALRAESTAVGRESMIFGNSAKTNLRQRVYVREDKKDVRSEVIAKGKDVDDVSSIVLQQPSEITRGEATGLQNKITDFSPHECDFKKDNCLQSGDTVSRGILRSKGDWGNK